MNEDIFALTPKELKAKVRELNQDYLDAKDIVHQQACAIRALFWLELLRYVEST